MFQEISFYTYHVSMDARRVASDSDREIPIKLMEHLFSREDSFHIENHRNSVSFFTGDMQLFFRPPVAEHITHMLYYLETFTVFHCDSPHFTRRQNFTSYMILYTYEGNGFLEYEGKTYELGPEDGFFIDCKKPHHYYSEDPGWTHSVLHFNGPQLPALYEQYMKNNSAKFTLPFTGFYQTTLESLLRNYQVSSENRDFIASDLISHLLTGLLSVDVHPEGAGRSLSEQLRYLVTYLENHYASSFTLEDLSAFSGISKYYLAREFKKLTGFSPMSYLIELRIEHAKTLLTSTSLPAYKIAEEVGFQDVNNFNNLFKKRVGCTPGRYRRTGSSTR